MPLLFGLACAGPAAADAHDACHPAFERARDVETARVADIEGEADLVLDDGRLLELAGLTRWSPAGASWLRAEVVGRRVAFRALGAPRDRWGRVPALAAPPPEGEAGPAARSLHARAVDAGLGVVVPSALPSACARWLLAREAGARTAGHGRWAGGGDADTAPAAEAEDAAAERPASPVASPQPTTPPPAVVQGVIAAADRATLEAHKGRFVIVEGRVVSVGERATVDYINFGSDFRRDLAATSSKALSRALAAAGTPVSSLRGRLVRVRGLVEGRNALLVRLDGPDSVELLDDAGRGPGPPVPAVAPRAPPR